MLFLIVCVFFFIFSKILLFILICIYLASWNASIDLQAQDRAFRLGQKKDCRIYRFVSSGTIEEAQYQRQLYKQQMQSISLEGKQERRLFKGVQGVQGEEGELFGIANLLKQANSTANIIRRNESLEETWEKAKLELTATTSNSGTEASNPNALIFTKHCLFKR